MGPTFICVPCFLRRRSVTGPHDEDENGEEKEHADLRVYVIPVVERVVDGQELQDSTRHGKQSGYQATQDLLHEPEI